MRNTRVWFKRLFSFLCLCVMISCGDRLLTPTEPQPTPSTPDYARGRIILSFVEGTLKPEAKALITSYGLSIWSWSPVDFTFATVRVQEGTREAIIPRLEAHPRIGLVKLLETPDQLWVYFTSPDFQNLPIEEVEAILGEFPQIELVKDEVYYRFMRIIDAEVVVPEGQEQWWIQTFAKHPIVSRGGLSYFYFGRHDRRH